MKRPSLGYSNYHWINSDKKRYKELDAISEQNTEQEITVSTTEEKISQQTTVSTTEESQNTETKNITTVIPAPIVVHTIYQETKNHLP